MIVFEIKVNDEQACYAGIDSKGVLSTIITWVKKNQEELTSNEVNKNQFKEEITLNVGGLATGTNENKLNLNWINRTLQVGDEINIKIIENSHIDEPTRKEEENLNLIEQQERQYYEQLKQKYGD